ncbi:serine/threonine phosphatase [Fortiea contorta]|uniref:serine/threonine phosphatase n=1 Tax=Fortiea contorta TaxID=1892405 RepID=UPI000475B4F4|nr:serine/threonine phosphatase [Fortiea contorta]
MLICPQCKFENSNSNKFCQNCGASLTHKVCPECSASVPVNSQSCHKCGADCGTVWWGILAQAAARENLGDGEATSSVPLSSRLTVGSYLDHEQRYQILTELLPNQEQSKVNTAIGVKVLDCQPYQISLLETMLVNQQQGLVTPSAEVSKIPHLAKPYIDLKALEHPGIPQIHDAWLQNSLELILIEDRSDWQHLLDLWKKDTTSSLQILDWCYQMTQLWSVLESVNCRQSLLELTNLRLDEDQTLALRQLYLEPVELPDVAEETSAQLKQPLTIKALGLVWQKLFKQSQRTQFGVIVQMLGDLEQGKIETIAQLRSRLKNIADELQTPTETFVPKLEIPASSPTTLQLEPSDESDDFSTTNDELPTIILSMQLSSLEDAGRTDVGRQRHHNEDYFGIETKLNKLELPRNRLLQARGLYVLCDGMGGHAGGEVASELAVNTLRQYFQEHWTTDQLPSEQSIREAVYLANQAIYDLNQQDARSGVGRMGTTLVMLLIQDTYAAVAHVGDSRLYRLTRKRGLEQITVDHEVGQREMSRGVEASIAYARPDAYQLTQALGPRDEHSVNPDVTFFEINQDSLFILASDGLSDNDLLEIHCQNLLLSLLSSGTNLEGGVIDLIDLANQHNGHDNITAILVRAKVRPTLEK